MLVLAPLGGGDIADVLAGLVSMADRLAQELTVDGAQGAKLVRIGAQALGDKMVDLEILAGLAPNAAALAADFAVLGGAGDDLLLHPAGKDAIAAHTPASPHLT